MEKNNRNNSYFFNINTIMYGRIFNNVNYILFMFVVSCYLVGDTHFNLVDQNWQEINIK